MRFDGETCTYDFELAPIPTSAKGLVDFTTLDPRWSGTRDASSHDSRRAMIAVRGHGL